MANIISHFLSNSLGQGNCTDSSWLGYYDSFERSKEDLWYLCRFATACLPTNQSHCVLAHHLQYFSPVFQNRQFQSSNFSRQFLFHPYSRQGGLVVIKIQENMKGVKPQGNREQLSSPQMSPSILSPNWQAWSREEGIKTGQFLRDTMNRGASDEMQKDGGSKDESWADNYSEVSLLLTDISIPDPQRINYNPSRFFQLQNKITQHILELREQKITLMQTLSSSIDSRNLYQHYKLKKTKQDHGITNPDSRMAQESSPPHALQQPDNYNVPTYLSAPILKRNEQLHRKVKELQVKEQIFGPSYQEHQGLEDNPKLMKEVVHFQNLNAKLQQQIENKLRASKTSKDSRLITFQPQDKVKHQELDRTQTKLDNLKNHYSYLLSKRNQSPSQLSTDEQRFVESLRNQNEVLLRQVEEMLRQKQGSQVGRLRNKLAENQREKSVFLSELQRFRQTMRSLKEQNSKMKSELNS